MLQIASCIRCLKSVKIIRSSGAHTENRRIQPLQQLHNTSTILETSWKSISSKIAPTRAKGWSMEARDFTRKERSHNWRFRQYSSESYSKDSIPMVLANAWGWIGGGLVAFLIVGSPWLVPLLKSTHVVLTREDEIEFERSKKNSDTQIDYQRAMREQVMTEVKPRTWLEKRLFDFRCLVRSLELALLFTPSLLVGLVAYWIPSARPMWYWLMHNAMDTAGGCWIKLAQWATTRPDVFSPALLSVLAQLQDHCSPHSFTHTRNIIARNYGGDQIEDLFDQFETTPIAVGAIAQVYRARLRSSGEEVAVKVLHPNIAAHIQVDLALMHTGASLLSLLPSAQWLGLTETVEQFASSMIAQVDMTFEARNLMRFNQNFKDDPAVIFPRVADHMSTKEVLVESFEHGEPLSTFLKHFTDVQARKELAHTGLRAYLTMLLLHNFIHADLHPGNLLVRQDPGTGKTHVVLLDVGLVCELSEYDWLHFKSLFRSIVMGDGRTAARIMLEHTRQKQITEAEKDSFIEEMNDLYTQLRHYKMAELDIGLFLTRVLDVVRKYKVRHDPNFTTLIVGTVVLEGIGRQLDPTINILDQSVPYLVWSEKANIQDRMIYLREMVRDEFERDDSKDIPLSTKIHHILKPILDSGEVLRSKL